MTASTSFIFCIQKYFVATKLMKSYILVQGSVC